MNYLGVIRRISIDRSVIIIRLLKDLQLKALLRDKRLKIKPFSHGAKMGWVELDKAISILMRLFTG
jgi:hypothetical protein